MQLATISDTAKTLSDTSAERVTSLMTRVGARAVAQQNQQQFATFLADEQATSNTNTDSSLKRTAKSNTQSENTQSSTASETTSTRENDPVRSDRGVRDTQTYDEDPPPEDNTQDMQSAPRVDKTVPVHEPAYQDNGQIREETTDDAPKVHSDESDASTADETVQAEVLALTALRLSPIVPRDVTQVTSDTSTDTDIVSATQNDSVDTLSNTLLQKSTTESGLTKGVMPDTVELLAAKQIVNEIPSPSTTKQLPTEMPIQGVEASSDDGNLVLAQIINTDDAIDVSSIKSDFSMLLAANSETAVNGDSKVIKENVIATGSASTDNLIITGKQTASGKSLTEMAVTFLPNQGRGGEQAGPEDMAVSSENRSNGTTTPVVGLQTLSSTKGLFSVRSAGMTSASSSTPVVDLAVETVRYMTANGEKTMTVRLSPASLGDMRIEVSTVNDILNVKLVSANSTARDLLNQHVDLLRDALSQGGLEIGRVTVTSGFGSATGSHLSQQQSDAWSQGSSSTSTPGTFSLAAATEDMPVQRSRRVAYYNGALDVSV